MNQNYDASGKADMSGIYNRTDPVPYFETLGTLGYCIPQEAKGTVRALINALRKIRRRPETSLLDIGCSYGVNAALLKYDMTFEDLREHYTSMADIPRDGMLREDAQFFSDPYDPELEVIGMDTAHRALRYAIDAGLVDGGTTVNLEEDDCELTPAHRKLLSRADLILSTGCFGYVTNRTLDRLLACGQDNHPWMCHTVLRMFDFTDAAEALAAQGYVTEKLDRLMPQRRFVDENERKQVLANLEELGVDSADLEAEGWYYAQLFVSRPVQDARDMPLPSLLANP